MHSAAEDGIGIPGHAKVIGCAIRSWRGALPSMRAVLPPPIMTRHPEPGLPSCGVAVELVPDIDTAPFGFLNLRSDSQWWRAPLRILRRTQQHSALTTMALSQVGLLVLLDRKVRRDLNPKICPLHRTAGTNAATTSPGRKPPLRFSQGQRESCQLHPRMSGRSVGLSEFLQINDGGRETRVVVPGLGRVRSAGLLGC